MIRFVNFDRWRLILQTGGTWRHGALYLPLTRRRANNVFVELNFQRLEGSSSELHQRFARLESGHCKI